MKIQVLDLRDVCGYINIDVDVTDIGLKINKRLLQKN